MWTDNGRHSNYTTIDALFTDLFCTRPAAMLHVAQCSSIPWFCPAVISSLIQVIGVVCVPRFPSRGRLEDGLWMGI